MACTAWTRGEHPRRIAAREMRDWWDEGGFEVRSSRFSELRTSDRAFLACLALHAPRPVTLADFFSILLVTRHLVVRRY